MPRAEPPPEDEDADMIAIQAPYTQFAPFNSRSSLIWTQRAGNSSQSQLNVQRGPLDSTRYSCFQLSPIAANAPAMLYTRVEPIRVLPTRQNDDPRPRMPAVVERAMAPGRSVRPLQPAQSLSYSQSSRRPERGGSPMIMERYLAEYQEVRESRTTRRRQERSPPQHFDEVPAELMTRARATRELVGEQFLLSLDQASCFSPEVELAIRMIHESRQPGQEDYQYSRRASPPLPYSSQSGIDSRIALPQRDLVAVGRSSRSRRSGDEEAQLAYRLGRAIHVPEETQRRGRSSSVPSILEHIDRSSFEPPPAPRVDSFPVDLRSTTSTRKSSKSRKTGKSREIRFTEVRSLQDGDRPSSEDRKKGLGVLLNPESRSHTPGPGKQKKVEEYEDEANSQDGWDGSQCSSGERQTLQSPQAKLAKMLSDTHIQDAALDEADPNYDPVIYLLPQPLNFKKAEGSSGRHPKLRFSTKDEDRTLPYDLIASRGAQLRALDLAASQIPEEDEDEQEEAEVGAPEIIYHTVS